MVEDLSSSSVKNSGTGLLSFLACTLLTLHYKENISNAPEELRLRNNHIGEFFGEKELRLRDTPYPAQWLPPRSRSGPMTQARRTPLRSQIGLSDR
jgi:hypothetical protein